MATTTTAAFALSISSSILWHHCRKSTSINKLITIFKKKASVFMALAATTTKVVPAVIVGGRRVGKALEDMGNGDDVLVKRGESVPPLIFLGLSLFVPEMMILRLFLSPLLSAVEAVLDKEAFQKQMLEKLIWICVFMLVGARHSRATVGAVEKEYRSEVSSLISEFATAAAAEKSIVFEPAMEDRLCAYSRAVAHFPTVVKEVKNMNFLADYVDD